MTFFSSQGSPEASWKTLLEAGLVQGEMPADPTKARSKNLPWFVSAMLGVGAWLSTLCLGLVVGLLLATLTWATLTLGMGLCALATFAFRKKPSSAWVEQLLFVGAIWGQLLVLHSLLDGMLLSNGMLPSLLVVLFEVAMGLAIPYFPQRLLSGVLALVFLYKVAFFLGIGGLFLPLCLAWLAVGLHKRWRAPRFWPMATLALSLAPLVSEPLWLHSKVLNAPNVCPLWLPQLLFAAVWLGVIYALLKQLSPKPFSFENVGIWLLALLLAAGAWFLPFLPWVLFSLAVFLLGFSHRDKPLIGISLTHLLWVIGYYAPQNTLLFNSLLFFALGALLLLLYALRRLFHRTFPI
ncbi:MAG: DUF4401 domain-containing protein [Cystobacterineae bacterium]|nr:DUF4401 domain-containing protein [Cystobacterineae bacterium]